MNKNKTIIASGAVLAFVGIAAFLKAKKQTVDTKVDVELQGDTMDLTPGATVSVSQDMLDAGINGTYANAGCKPVVKEDERLYCVDEALDVFLKYR